MFFEQEYEEVGGVIFVVARGVTKVEMDRITVRIATTSFIPVGVIIFIK